MDRVSVPFVEIKKELLNEPEFKEEYDKLKQEYQVTDELQALTMELQTLSDSGRHKKEFEQKLKMWHELKQQKIITMLQPILLSIYGENIMEIISFVTDDLSYINLALLLEKHVEVPPRVEYSLSELGLALKPILDSMVEWGNAYKKM